MWRNFFTKLLVLLTLVALLGGCGRGPFRKWFAKREKERPPDVMAKEGIRLLKKKKYIDAAETFTKLKDRYPYSEQALLAQIKLADSLYYNKKYDEAQQAYKEFEKLHPTNKAVPYVIYQQGMSFYRQRATVDRDQTFTEKAVAEFSRLRKKFPKSQYAVKAEKYIARCRRELAEHEFYVADFYLRTKRYTSALDRFQALSQDYPEFKPGEIRGKIETCKTKMATPENARGFFSRLFDARW